MSPVVEERLVELTRKVAVLEVNEAVLSRRYMAQADQLKVEQEAKHRVETDFIEMEVPNICFFFNSNNIPSPLPEHAEEAYFIPRAV